MLQAAAADVARLFVDAVKRFSEAQPKSDVPAEPQTELSVSLWASELAAYAGKDPWLTRNQALAKVWKRTSERSFRNARDAWLLRGQKPIHFTSKDILSPDRNVVSVPSKTCIDPFLSVQTPEDVQAFRASRSPGDVVKLYRVKGKLLEEETAALFERSIGAPVGLRNSSVFWNPASRTGGLSAQDVPVRPLGPITSPGPYFLSGEMDACMTTPPFENVPVEFKLRMSGAVSVSYRDMTQVQAYMSMVGSDRAFHVQRVFGSQEVLVTTIHRDSAFWHDEIVPAMEDFVCDVRRLLRGSLWDEELRHEVLVASETSVLSPPVVSFDVEMNEAIKRIANQKPQKRKKKGPELDLKKYNLRSRASV